MDLRWFKSAVVQNFPCTDKALPRVMKSDLGLRPWYCVEWLEMYWCRLPWALHISWARSERISVMDQCATKAVPLHAMVALEGRGGTRTLCSFFTLYLGTRWRWVVSVTPWRWVGLPIALMMEATITCETPVNFYQTTRRYNLEDSDLHIRLNLKSHYMFLAHSTRIASFQEH
jgi:hypothetical protein